MAPPIDESFEFIWNTYSIENLNNFITRLLKKNGTIYDIYFVANVLRSNIKHRKMYDETLIFLLFFTIDHLTYCKCNGVLDSVNCNCNIIHLFIENGVNINIPYKIKNNMMCFMCGGQNRMTPLEYANMIENTYIANLLDPVSAYIYDENI